MSGQGRIYVLGEREEPDGYVKIGMVHDDKPKSGISGGNWRVLEHLGHVNAPSSSTRWREFVIHRRLRHLHKGGEWFDVRGLAAGMSWRDFLNGVLDGTLPGIVPFDIASDDGLHRVLDAHNSARPPRKDFTVVCSCGERFEAGEGVTLPSALTAFATLHLRLDPASELVRQLPYDTHHPAFSDSAKARHEAKRTSKLMQEQTTDTHQGAIE